jgi:hypothetical protein
MNASRLRVTSGAIVGVFKRPERDRHGVSSPARESGTPASLLPMTSWGRSAARAVLPRAAVTALIIGIGLIAGSTTANASEYSKSDPHFDRLTMLRVAMAYNLSSGSTDLSFPANSQDACRIAGLGALTWVSNDHGPWAQAHKAAYDATIEPLLGDPYFACTWLSSDPANELVPGVSKVWGATMKPNFKRLRKGLRQANCKTVYKALDLYPTADMPADRIHRRVVVIMGGPCQKGHPPRS